ncbi:MAG: J domain-containing protein [Bdellovibrionales bacterium]|nr:J domain-containing protein [Bdellovibrionales bacterium]
MDTSGKTYYEMLGLERSASAAEIKAAYREIARIFHPDSNYYSDITELGLSEADIRTFKDITAAYNTLIDPQKKAEYDRALPAEFRSWDDGDEPDWETPEQYLRWHSKQRAASNSKFGDIDHHEVEVEAEHVDAPPPAKKNVQAVSQIIRTQQVGDNTITVYMLAGVFTFVTVLMLVVLVLR